MQTIDLFSESDSSDSNHSSRLSSPDRVWTPEDLRLANGDRRSRVSTNASSSMATDVHNNIHYDDEESELSCPIEESIDSVSECEVVTEESHPLPTTEQLKEAANIPIYDADGQSIPFRSLYQGPEHQGQRQLLIFIRHFYCGSCQAYVRRVTETISPAVYFSLPIPTTITIIGCGEPHIIPHHAIKSHCPFRYYADPTRRLYKLFNMPQSMLGGRKPKYTEHHGPTLLYRSISQMLRASRDNHFKLKGGHPWQVGGEFLFEDGLPIWCHRMTNMRNHAEMDVLKRVLGASDAPIDEDDPPNWLPNSRRNSRKPSTGKTSLAPVPMYSSHQSSLTSSRRTSSGGVAGGGGLRLVYNAPRPGSGRADETPRARLVRDDGRTPSVLGR